MAFAETMKSDDTLSFDWGHDKMIISLRIETVCTYLTIGNKNSPHTAIHCRIAVWGLDCLT